MIGRILAAGVALTLAGTGIAQTAGEKWQEVRRESDRVFAIDTASIKTVGGLRHFRIRLTQIGGTMVGYFDNAADCRAMTVDTLYAEVSDKGEMLHKQAFKPGELRNRLDDEQGKLIYPFVCGS